MLINQSIHHSSPFIGTKWWWANVISRRFHELHYIVNNINNYIIHHIIYNINNYIIHHIIYNIKNYIIHHIIYNISNSIFITWHSLSVSYVTWSRVETLLSGHVVVSSLLTSLSTWWPWLQHFTFLNIIVYWQDQHISQVRMKRVNTTTMNNEDIFLQDFLVIPKRPLQNY